MFCNDGFSQFLKLDEHASDTLLNKICLVGRLTHPAFGYRDVIIQEDKGILYSLTSQMEIGTRVDSYLTNKLYRSNTLNGGFKMSIAAVECWIQKSNGAEEFTYQQIWMRTFNSQAICMHLSKVHNMLLIGCDNGEIVLIVVDPEKPDEYTELKEIKTHTKRVMAVWMDDDCK